MSASGSQPEAPRRKRRWLQYRLRTLLLLMLLVSLGMSWFAPRLQRARRQREAVEAILAAGGSVSYDYEFDPSWEEIQGATPPTPAWLRLLLGEDFFSRVAEA